MKVINLTVLSQQVHVRHADGKLDGISIMPRGRVDLRAGMVVDPRWLELNPGVLRIHAPAPVVQIPKTTPEVPTETEV